MAGDGTIQRPIRVKGSTPEAGLYTAQVAPKSEPHTWRKKEGKRVSLYKIPGATPRKYLKQPFRFLCPPYEQWTATYGHNSSSYQVVRGGEKSNTAGKKLRTVSFETLFVIGMYWWTIANNGREGYDPERQVAILRQLSEHEVPFRLVISDSFENSIALNVPMQLAEVTKTEKAGEPLDYYVTVQFNEYTNAEVQRKQLGGGQDWPQYATLDEDTTLSDLAKQFWGKPSAASFIGEANPGLTNWGSNSPIIGSKRYQVGDKVKIPDPAVLGGGTKAEQPNKASHSTADALEAREVDDVFGEG